MPPKGRPSAKTLKGKLPAKVGPAEGQWVKGIYLRVGDVILNHNVVGYQKGKFILEGNITSIDKPKNRVLMTIYVEGSEYAFRVLHSDSFYIKKRDSKGKDWK